MQHPIAHLTEALFNWAGKRQAKAKPATEPTAPAPRCVDTDAIALRRARRHRRPPPASLC